MPQQYTVVFTHPRGGTATFIYQMGELSALAKGLDPEQFWVFKQVKSLLLRNDEGDLEHAKQMMARHGFESHVTRAPLPDLLATAPATLPRHAATQAPMVRFRRPPAWEYDYAVYKHNPQVSEMHWREGDHAPAMPLPPHKAPALPVPEDVPFAQTGAVAPWKPATTPQVSEMHWREPEDRHA